MRLVDQYNPFKTVEIRMKNIVRDLQKALEARKIWRRFATHEVGTFDPHNMAEQM